MDKLSPFHLAIPVRNLKESRQFYGELLGCVEGRSSDIWIDFNFFGHQLVCHESSAVKESSCENPVDGKEVPIPHFGVVLEMHQWCELRDKLLAVDMQFVIAPYIRFEGQVGEQTTMFFYDPSGNALEFKSFKDIEGELFKNF